MAIAVYFNPPALTATVYDEAVGRLEAAGQGTPAGRLSHCAFGSADKLQIFDVWDSQEAFQKFGEIMLALSEEYGIDMGEGIFEPVHNLIIPS